MAEIADDQLDVLTRGMKLLQTLNGKPESRRHLEAALKAVDPQIRTTEEQARELLAPELSAMETLAAEVRADREARAKDAEARTERDDSERMNVAFRAIRDDGATDEGLEKVKELMVERNIADPLAAWALFQKQNPTVLVESASYEPSHWNFEKDAVETDVEGLWKDPDKWADQEAGRILMDMRKSPISG